MDVPGKSNFLMNTLLEEGLIPFSRTIFRVFFGYIYTLHLNFA